MLEKIGTDSSFVKNGEEWKVFLILQAYTNTHHSENNMQPYSGHLFHLSQGSGNIAAEGQKEWKSCKKG